MKPREVIPYLTGEDYLQEHIDYQQNLLAENTGIDGPHLPFDGDLETAGRVYADRLRTIVEYPVVLALRLTGVDAALRKIREQLAKEANK